MRHPIGFWSRSLTEAEINYSVGEKECLAVVWAIQVLRPYLDITHFDLYTDHQSLKWIFNLSDASGRLARWRLRLMESDFTIKYKKGAANTVADAISRLPTYGETTFKPDFEITCFPVGDCSLYEILIKQLNDEEVAYTPMGVDKGSEIWDHDPEDVFFDEFLHSMEVIYAIEEFKEITPIRIETLVKDQARE